MAMNGNTLGTEIDTAIRALSPAQQLLPVEVWKAISSAIVNHITGNAQINTNVSVTSVSGVTTGPGVSGPGSGTGTGTIS